MKKAIITVGVSGSGKTTWAKKQSGFAIISRDDIRAEMYYSETGKPFEWSAWKWSKEDDVTAIQNQKFKTASENGYNIIVADTNLNKGRANGLKKMKNAGSCHFLALATSSATRARNC